MLQIVCPVPNVSIVKINKDGSCIIKIRTKYALIEKFCRTRPEAMTYLKEVADNFEVKGYSIGPQTA